MSCLKCGSDTAGGAVFCDNCLKEMSRYPVSRETPVYLPKRVAPEPERHARRAAKQPPKPEELVERYKKRNRTLRKICISLAVALSLLIVALVVILQQTSLRPNIGQNYSTQVTGGSR